MIKRALVISLLLLPAIAASTSCSTCPKGYAISSMEEILISREKEKESTLKGMAQGTSLSQGKELEKSSIQIVASKTEQLKRKSSVRPVSDMLQSYVPKRDTVLDIAHTPLLRPWQNFSGSKGNQNLRETFAVTETLNAQQRFRQQMQKKK